MEIHERLKSAYLGIGRVLSDNRLMDYKWLLEQEVDTWNSWTSLPLRRRLWLLQNGFTSPQGKLYDFESYDPNLFLSELQRYRLYRALNGRQRYLIDDKLCQHWMLADYPENRPDAYGLVDGGYVHGVTGTTLDSDPVPVSEWLPAAVREHETVVLKQVRGKGGKQVLVCRYDGDYSLDGEPISERALCDEVATLSGYLASEYVEQHAYADELYPHATNTVRILTLWDDEADELIIPFAVQRIGTDRSRPIDNFSSGGIAAEIDIETGELSRAVQRPRYSASGEAQWYERHPDTGALIEGTSVSRWESIRSTVARLAMDNTNIPALGWDVLLDESGQPIVIEANSGTGFDVLQVHRPLLSDPRVRRLVSRYLPDVDGGRPEPSGGRRRPTERRRRESPEIRRTSD